MRPASMLNRRNLLTAGISFVVMTAASGMTRAEPGWVEDSIRVRCPNSLRVDRIRALRVPLGVPGDYKPCIAKLSSGELLVVAFHQQKKHRPRAGLTPAKFQEDIVLFRSRDGGLTWSPRQVVASIAGREPCLTVLKDGTLLMTTHMNYSEVRNQEGAIYSYLYRSKDRGATWQTLRIDWRDVPDTPKKNTLPEPFIAAWTLTGRNVLQTAEGSLILGVSSWMGHSYLWRSSDDGKTWDKTQVARFEGLQGEKLPRFRDSRDNGGFPRMDEAVFWQARSGDLLGLFRVDSRLFAPLPGTKVPQEASDHYTRMLVFRSRDSGRSWKSEPELGSYYGEMYPSILKLADGRLLLTFTVRAVRAPLGVQAVLGRERHDGFEFDFDHDRLVLDARTPLNKPSGGGFGNTIQMKDGTLVTSYSYRGADDQTHIEVVRWKLPE